MGGASAPPFPLDGERVGDWGARTAFGALARSAPPEGRSSSRRPHPIPTLPHRGEGLSQSPASSGCGKALKPHGEIGAQGQSKLAGMELRRGMARPFWILSSLASLAALLSAMASLAHTVRPSGATVASTDGWRVLPTPSKRPRPDDLPDATIRFANGFSFRPGLYYPTVIGRLTKPTGAPFVVLDAVDCNECDATARSIYIGDPTNWRVNRDNPTVQWFAPYPSRNLSETSRKLMTWSRLFVGRCLGDDREVVLSFAGERERVGWKRTIDWAYAEDGHLAVHSVRASAAGAPSLRLAAKLTKTPTCREIPSQLTTEGDF
jgi:hypothetical protein